MRRYLAALWWVVASPAVYGGGGDSRPPRPALEKQVSERKYFDFNGNDLMQEVIYAGEDCNREPAHLRLLAAAWMTRARNTFHEKAKKIRSPNEIALHWASVLYTITGVLEKSVQLCSKAAERGLRSIDRVTRPTEVVENAVRSAAINSTKDAILEAAWDSCWRFSPDSREPWDPVSLREHWNLAEKDPAMAIAGNNSGDELHLRDVLTRPVGAVMEALARGDIEYDSDSMIGAIAYRSAETELLLTLISQEDGLAGILYDSIASSLTAEDPVAWISHSLLRDGPLSSKQNFNNWKNTFASRLQGDESKYCFVQGLLEELEAIAQPLWQF